MSIQFEPQKSPINPSAQSFSQPLRIYGVLSPRKEIDWVSIQGKFHLIITPGFSPQEAIANAILGMNKVGLNPVDYNMAMMMVSMPIDVVSQRITSTLLPTSNPPTIPSEAEEKKSLNLNKSLTNMIAYLRYISDSVATDDEKVVVENLVKKFSKKYNESGTKNVS